MKQKIPFVLAATAHGPMIVNRLDGNPVNGALGVGQELLRDGEHEPQHIKMLLRLLDTLHRVRKRDVFVIDGGANFGTFTLDIARFINGWGTVLAFEPQMSLYCALCGNIALNNLWNAYPYNKALAGAAGEVSCTDLDPHELGDFSSVKFDGGTIVRSAVAIDDLRLAHLDLIKLDIEGMEAAALIGGRATIERCRPVIFAETLFAKAPTILAALPADYHEFIVRHTESFFYHKDDRGVLPT